MAGGNLLRFPGSRQAYTRYGYDLSSIYGRHTRIDDPDYALSQDPAIYDKVQRDPVIAHAILQRLHGVAAKSWGIEPASDRDADKAAAAIVEESLRKIRRFQQARFNLAWSVIKGKTFAKVVGERRRQSLDDGPVLEWWQPTLVEDIDKRRFRFAPKQDREPDSIEVELQLWHIGKRRWETLDPVTRQSIITVVYQDREDRLGYGEGLIVPIYHYFFAKGIVWREGLQGLSRWAQGIVAAKVDLEREGDTDKTNEDIIAEWLDVLDEMRGRHALVFGKNDDLEVHEHGGTGHQMVTGFLEYLDQSLTRLILGSIRPTGADTDTGSRAQGEVEAESTESLIQYDRTLVDEAITDWLIALWWRVNRPQLVASGLADAQMPSFVTRTERVEDPSQVVAVVGQALQSGIPLAQQEVYERLGFRQPQTDEDTFKGQTQDFGFGGFPGLGAPAAREPAPSLGLPEPAPEQAEGADLKADEEKSFNELTLALERLAKIGDADLVQAVREELFERLGKPPTGHVDVEAVSKESEQEFRDSSSPDPRGEGAPAVAGPAPTKRPPRAKFEQERCPDGTWKPKDGP